MAVKLEGSAAQVPAEQVTSKVKVEKVVEVPGVILVLDLYNIYHRSGTRFEKFDSEGNQKRYKFTPGQAIVLLDETDGGRAIWKRYRPEQTERIAKAKLAAKNAVYDQTHRTIKEAEPDPFSLPAERKAIEVGNDDEIADILNAEEGVEV